ncbi:MAG: hypothetical protein COV35_03240 [Alphaproteobacteria bacterium CG11_big_fil_rev_8_21_14_0_20_39_49]|nr:MAG: hypothetical protein COV35_03240 [Alphaproteobacteria bacterium CG11_big_fil_rev_8_21_14_0_20_39_49]
MAKEKNSATSEEKAKKKIKSNKRSELKGIGIFGKIIGLGIVVWLISISYYAFAFFLLGMLPSILSMTIDRGAGRFASKTVTACNFTAVIPYLFEIGLTYEKDIYAKHLMTDPLTWFVIYGFSAVGWMLIWILPNLSLIFITARADMQTKALKNEQKKLLDEWGEDIITGKSRIATQKEAAKAKKLKA